MPAPSPVRPPRKKKSSARIPDAAKFAALLKKAPPRAHYELRLFVTGNSPRSMQAIANIRALCQEHLGGRYTLEVVDIYQQPHRAIEEQIIAAPTLVKRLPLPLKRLIGDLSDRERVLVTLNILPSGSRPGAAVDTHWLKL